MIYEVQDGGQWRDYVERVVNRVALCNAGNSCIVQELSRSPTLLHTLDWIVYTCLTQLYGGRDMYNLLHKEDLHVSALFIGHLQVDKYKTQ